LNRGGGRRILGSIAGVPEDEVTDPRSGQRVVFRRTGEVLELDLFVSRGAFVAQHVHPTQEETFTGVTGTFVLEVGGEVRTIRPGDSVTIPPRTSHGFDAAVDDAHLLVTVRPGLELDRYFRAYLGLSRDGRLRVPARGIPKPFLLFAVLLHRYRREMAAPRIPLWVQRPLLAGMALLGRALGRRASFPEYGAP
jgi:quercetin dioxygenase-like cupin family protein